MVRKLNDEVPSRWIIVSIKGVHECCDPMTTVVEVAKLNVFGEARCRAVWKSGRKGATKVLPNYDLGHGPSSAAIGASFVNGNGSFGRFISVKEHPPDYNDRHNYEEPLNHLAGFSKMTVAVADPIRDYMTSWRSMKLVQRSNIISSNSSEFGVRLNWPVPRTRPSKKAAATSSFISS